MSYRASREPAMFRYPITLILTVLVTAGTLILTYCAGVMSGMALDRPDLQSSSTLVAVLALVMATVGPLTTLGFYRLERAKTARTDVPVGEAQI